jgi:hypothetical protein
LYALGRWVPIPRPDGPGLCRILHPNFGELLFYEVG